MKKPGWLKPGVFGAMFGAVVLAIVGFSWGGWMTSSKAAVMAASQARQEVVAVLVPICIEQSKRDPKFAETMALLKDAKFYERTELLMKAGWATMPGSSDANSRVASACVEELAAQF